jgi:hypothetical protein
MQNNIRTVRTAVECIFMEKEYPEVVWNLPRSTVNLSIAEPAGNIEKPVSV